MQVKNSYENNKEIIINIGKSSLGFSIIFMFGYKIPSEKQKLENCQLYFVSLMDEIANKFSILS